MVERKAQMEEAIRRITVLTEKYDLNPNLLKYFKEGKIYYTECFIPGVWASMDNITYDKKYVDVVKQVEKEMGVLVYHCILTGPFFSMLCVSPHETDWPVEEPNPNSDWIAAAIYNFDYKDYEFGDIKLSVASKTLFRIG